MTPELFHPAVGAWFERQFAAPTEPQRRAWPSIQRRRHTLIAAPTGSGKTLAAFLAALDDLVRQGLAGPLADATQVVYVSPLKALSSDIQKNLQAPLAGIEQELLRAGLPTVPIRVLVRTGDTPQAERTAMVKRPPHILVTTPESLYILLTSEGGRAMLATARTVIVDEIHALVGNKRGSHLALSLERLEALVRAHAARQGAQGEGSDDDTVAERSGTAAEGAARTESLGEGSADAPASLPHLRRSECAAGEADTSSVAEPVGGEWERTHRTSKQADESERGDEQAQPVLVRIGLSATQRPIEEVARFLVGAAANGKDSPGAEATPMGLSRAAPPTSSPAGRAQAGNEAPDCAKSEVPDCTIVDSGHIRDLDLAIEVPGSPLQAVMPLDVWAKVYDRLAALIREHRTTLVFVNTRRLAERAARHLSERLGAEHVTSHHGSLSREQRLAAEQRLKAGTLQALVATASLELGIDIGSVDLVCQLGSTRSISTWLQRAGRSGHSVGGFPKGRLFPLTRDELAECAAILDSIRRGELDQLIIPEQPLDILAQQLVAAVACEEWEEDALFATVRRAYPYRDLARRDFDAVVRMLAQGFTTKRGRRSAYLHHDAVNGRLRARRGARLAAITSGGAIPDNADYSVVLEPAGIVIGAVHEDFAVESLAGDIFQLGNASWKIVRIEPGKVRVEDARGAPPSIPFWLGEAPSRTEELSQSVSRLRVEVAARLGPAAAAPEGCAATSTGHTEGEDDSVRPQGERDGSSVRLSAEPIERAPSAPQPIAQLAHGQVGGSEQQSSPYAAARAWLEDEVGVAPAAAEQIVEYFAAARAALGELPSRETLVLERFFDESGGMQLVLHAPFGSRINRAWGLALRKRFCRKFNFELQAAATEDAIVLSLGPAHSFPLEEVFQYLRAETVKDVLVQAMLDAPMFPVRWRWNASRALALPRWRGGRKVPPPLQRMEAEDLLALVFPDQLACLQDAGRGEREIPDHPLVNQTIRDCLEEAMDLEGLKAILTSMARGEIRLVARDLREPSPFAYEILSAKPYAFLDDAPLEERRTQAVMTRRWLDPQTASDLGTLDAAAIARVRAEAWPEVRSADELHDALLVLGFLTAEEGRRGGGSDMRERAREEGHADSDRAGADGAASPPGEGHGIRAGEPAPSFTDGWEPLLWELIEAGRATVVRGPSEGPADCGQEEGSAVRGHVENSLVRGQAEGAVRPERGEGSSSRQQGEGGVGPERGEGSSVREQGEGASARLRSGVHGAGRGSALWVAAERLDEIRAAFPGRAMEPLIAFPPAATDGSAPHGSAPQGNAPQGNAPCGSAPYGSAAPLSAPRSVAADGPAALVEIMRARLDALGPVTAVALARSVELPVPQIDEALARLEAEGFAMRGRFTPGADETEWCSRRLLARIHRYTLDRLRREIEPVPAADFLRFLLEWQRVEPEHRPQGREALALVAAQMEGFEAPASAWEGEILPSRVGDYDPAWLDALCLSGRLVWGRLTPPAAARGADAQARRDDAWARASSGPQRAPGRSAPARRGHGDSLPPLRGGSLLEAGRARAGDPGAREDLHIDSLLRSRSGSLSEADRAGSGDPDARETRGKGPSPVRSTPITLVSRKSLAVWRERGTQAAAGTNGVTRTTLGERERWDLSPAAQAVHQHLAERGASFFEDLVEQTGRLRAEVENALGELVALGLVTSDSFCGLRAVLTPSDQRPSSAGGGRSRRSAAVFGMESAGRWTRLARDPGPAARTSASAAGPAARSSAPDPDGLETIARVLLRRWGVVFRRLLEREGLLPPWRDLLRAFRRLEARGEIRGGRFVDGFSGEQYALPEAVGTIRSMRKKGPSGGLVSVSAADPLNLIGILTPGHRLPALSSNRLLYRQGIPIALREGGAVRFLVPMDPASEWEAKRALLRRSIPPQLRRYLGRSA